MCNVNEAVSDNQNTDNSTEPDIQEKWNSIVTKNELRKLLNMMEMDFYKIINIEQLSRKSSDRYGLLLHLHSRNNDECWTEVMIDFRLGGPTWDQFTDVTYEKTESDFPRYVIIYDNYFDVPSTSAHVESDVTIYDLIRINNECGYKTFLIKADGIAKSFVSGGRNKIKYNIECGPSDYASRPDGNDMECDFPTKEQVQEMAKNKKCIV
jgi:hypothetical protein